MIDSGFETRSLRMELLLLVTFQAPAADVERIMEAVVAITPLRMGKYDSNAYQSAQGIERYRPLDGAAAGAETELRRRPGTVEVSFEIADDQALAARIVERFSRPIPTRSPSSASSRCWPAAPRASTTAPIRTAGGILPATGKRRGSWSSTTPEAVNPAMPKWGEEGARA